VAYVLGLHRKMAAAVPTAREHGTTKIDRLCRLIFMQPLGGKNKRQQILEHDRFKCDHALAFLMRAIHVLAPRKMREPKTIAL
jgi:hypothetical protein